MIFLFRLEISVAGKDYRLKIYGITGDCPALKIVCNFIGHNGYFCCFFCFIRGQHVHTKRQYYYEEPELRSTEDFFRFSREAERTQTNTFGHLGDSVLRPILDIKLPDCIVIDYLHVTLLGHAKRIILNVYQQLRPNQRERFDSNIKSQTFPRK